MESVGRDDRTQASLPRSACESQSMSSLQMSCDLSVYAQTLSRQRRDVTEWRHRARFRSGASECVAHYGSGSFNGASSCVTSEKLSADTARRACSRNEAAGCDRTPVGGNATSVTTDEQAGDGMGRRDRDRVRFGLNDCTPASSVHIAISDLPNDIMISVALCLPTVEIIDLRRVSRAWCTVLNDAVFRNVALRDYGHKFWTDASKLRMHASLRSYTHEIIRIERFQQMMFRLNGKRWSTQDFYSFWMYELQAKRNTSKIP